MFGLCWHLGGAFRLALGFSGSDMSHFLVTLQAAPGRLGSGNGVSPNQGMHQNGHTVCVWASQFISFVPVLMVCLFQRLLRGLQSVSAAALWSAVRA